MVTVESFQNIDFIFYLFLINFQCSVSCGVALALFYMQIAKFFPPNQALIIAVLNLSMQLSSSVPGFWMFLVDKKILTLSKIMMIWFMLPESRKKERRGGLQ